MNEWNIWVIIKNFKYWIKGWIIESMNIRMNWVKKLTSKWMNYLSKNEKFQELNS